jgi:FkbM family methyltransferase
MKVIHPLEFNKKNIDGSDNRNKLLHNLFDKKRLLKFLIKKNAPVIIDIGSNIGQSIDFFRSLFLKSKIHSFEPNLRCFNNLKKKYKNKKCIYLNNFAITNLKNKFFYVNNIHSGLGSFSRINTFSKDIINKKFFSKKYFIEKKIKVNTVTMKKYLLESRILKRIDLVKIDVQGHNMNVLKSFSNLINLVDNFLIEINFYDFYKSENESQFGILNNYMNNFGFYIYDIVFISKNPQNFRTDWIDILYRKKI